MNSDLLPAKGLTESTLSNRVLLVHPGTQYSHQLAKQLFRHALLYEFWTGFALPKDNWSTHILEASLPFSFRKKIANRLISGVPASRLRIRPFGEWRALQQIRAGDSPQKVFHVRNERFQESIPNSTIHNSAAVIGFDTSSWVIAERTLRTGKPFFLDQSAAHPIVNQAASEQVASQFPEWRTTLELRLPTVFACEQREHKLATKIVVASSYTKRTLVSQGVAECKISVNPYGVDLELFRPPTQSRRRQPLRFLFLGAVSARKGVALLVEAWRTLDLKDCELWLAGPISENQRKLIPRLPGLKVMGKCAFEDLPEILRSCDVLVFPSYSEGFGLVLLEALASGMPIITTESTAGPDLIQHGKEGFLIPAGDLESLRESIKYFVDCPEAFPEMSVAARRCAERFSWDRYGDRWRDILIGVG